MNSRVLETYDDEEQLISEKMNLHFMKFNSGLLLILLLAVLVVWTVMTLMRPDFLPIKHVRVEGEFHQLAPDRLEAIVTDTVRGGFFNVNVDVIQKVLLKDPWVYQVTVRRNWPDSLTVQVVEQTAIAQWGRLGLINPDGKLFKPEAYTFPQGLPILIGPEHTHSQMFAQLQKIRAVLKDTRFKISEVTLNERRSWTVQLTGGPLLVLGRKNVLKRLQRVAKFITSGVAVNLEDMEKVDLRYTNGFAVSWKNDSNKSELGQDNHGQKN